jgi:uncharacterized LabA/DUF88 family protein
MKRRINVYIDGSNTYFAQKKLGWDIDWVKCKNIIENKKSVGVWKYYTGVCIGEEKMEKFLKFLNNIGILTVTKPLKKIKLEKGRKQFKQNNDYIYKANFDVEITVDVLSEKLGVREIIIFSGDSDFAYLIRKLRAEGIKVLIVSSKRTLSWELKIVASKIIFLESLKTKILRK